MLLRSYKIKKIINSYNKLIDTAEGDRYFTIRLLKNGFSGMAPNIHILFENGKSLHLNLDVVDAKKSNQVVSFLDAETEIEQNRQYTKAYYEHLYHLQKEEIETKNNINALLLFDKQHRFEVNKIISFDNDKTTVKLVNISKVDDQVFYNLEISGKIPILKTEDILLETQQYDDKIVVENRGKIEASHPVTILNYESGKRTLVFQRNNIPETFYSNLRIGNGFRFEDKVDFRYQQKIAQTQFERF